MGGPSIAARSFCAAHQLYAAVRLRFDCLRLQEVDPNEETLSDIIRIVSKKCLIELPDHIPENRSPANFLKFISRRLDSIIQDFADESRSVLAIPILEEIKDDLKEPLPPEACASTMASFCAKAWEHLNNLVACWGGPLARERLKECRPAELVFEINNRILRDDLTYPSTRRGVNQIAWTIGHRAPVIEEFFSYEFYFLHEYLSHLFHTWDDVDPTLAETYLLRVAHSFLETRPDRPKNIDRLLTTRFLTRDFDALREPDERHVRIEERFGELFDCGGSPLLTFFLEWATQRPTAETDETHKDVMAGLYLLSDAEVIRALLNKGQLSSADEVSSLYSEVYAGLVSYSKQKQENVRRQMDALVRRLRSRNA